MDMQQDGFGQNQWLVNEMYRKFKNDPDSVDESWRAFFTAQKPQTSSTDTKHRPSPQVVSEPFGPSNPTAHLTGNALAEYDYSEQAAQPVNVKRASKEKVRSAAKDALTRMYTVEPDHKPSYPTLTEEASNVLRGAQRAIARNMNASRDIPMATSVRTIPVKLLFENRVLINNYLKRTRGGKVSFTHLIGYAMIQAIKAYPDMNCRLEEKDGKFIRIQPSHINLGLAVDLRGKDGTRNLVVAGIKETENMSFTQFVDAYEDIVKRARLGKLTPDDFANVTISLTNPGGIGTVHSVPRLTTGQGTIMGVGALQYPAEYAGMSDDALAELGVGKVMTITSTYDHRIIQGAESGEWLGTIHKLLLSDDLWDDVFASLQLPFEPFRWRQDVTTRGTDKNACVLQLINAFRERGHLIADTNPLNFVEPGRKREIYPELDMATYGLTIWDLDREFPAGDLAGQKRMKLRDILSLLRNSYCEKIGVEYSYILDTEQREWIRDYVETKADPLSSAEHKLALTTLIAAESFETFLQTKYVGQKRFSLEGAESLIPMMDTVIDTAANHNLSEVVIGMPHRGRLNVLANIVGKPYSQIFNEFEGNMRPDEQQGSGDVKYHLGASGVHYQMFGDNDIKVTLTANPSHLEAVDPVLIGIVRAKQDKLRDSVAADTDVTETTAVPSYPVMPLMLHGDAAFSGQGVVFETLNMALLEGYGVGGTIHIVVNNQIGFTTAPSQGRSSEYCTDVAKAFGVPVFHVNGDDPEACVRVARAAVEFQQRFAKDVVIDLVCYRRRGHNEADDPSMTQPATYSIIRNKASVRESYTKVLVGRGDITSKDAETAEKDYRGALEKVFKEVREIEKTPQSPSESVATKQRVPYNLQTAISRERIEEIGDAFTAVPDDFSVHRRVERILKQRHHMTHEGDVDWAMAELLAWGSLVQEGRTVRVAGEDSCRGTFTQRHAILVDQQNSNEYSPLRAIASAHGGKFDIYNSSLSEYAGIGFEYGYTLGAPGSLVCWEAQYGDFANGGQTIIDEYISSAEAKWNQRSDLVLLLPHGQEGAGPDHSSARLERFLQLCAESNMTIAQPTTPANYFHLLRRHALSSIVRPLIVATPKSMLRHKKAISQLEEFTDAKFRSVIDDPAFFTDEGNHSVDEVKTLVLCSGKIYYELADHREEQNRFDMAIARLEQIYPLPFRRISELIDRYPHVERLVWVQEEPANQGAQPFLKIKMPNLVPNLPTFETVSRRSMSAPATGVPSVSRAEQALLIEQLFQF